jgi:hypothetical protein
MIKDLRLNLDMDQLTELLNSIGDKVNLNIVLSPSNKARFKLGKVVSPNEFRDDFSDNFEELNLLDVQRDGCSLSLPAVKEPKLNKPKKRRFGKHTRITRKHLELRDSMNIAHYSGRLSAPSMRAILIKDCDLFDKKTKNFLTGLGYITLADVTKSTEALILGACSSLKFSDYVTKTGLGRVIECLEKIGVFLRK